MIRFFVRYFHQDGIKLFAMSLLLLLPFLSACTLDASLKDLAGKNLLSPAAGSDTTAPSVTSLVLNDGTTEWAKTKSATISWTPATGISSN